MEMNVRDVKRSRLWRNGFGRGTALLAIFMCALLMGPPRIRRSRRATRSITPSESSADQSKATDSKVPAKPQKELPPAESSAQESKSAQPNMQTSKSDESKTKKENGEEGTGKGKEGTGRKAVFR